MNYYDAEYTYESSPELHEVTAALSWMSDPCQARPWSMALGDEKEAAYGEPRWRREAPAAVRTMPVDRVQDVLADICAHPAPGVDLPRCPDCAVADCRHQAEWWLIEISFRWNKVRRLGFAR